MRTFLVVLLALLGFAQAQSADVPTAAAARVADLDWLVDQIGAHYAYLPERRVDLEKLRAIYRPQAVAATTPEAWLHVLEHVVGELHDHHATLGANVASSPQLIPTGTDLWARMRGRRAVLVEVRPGSPAAALGLHAGEQVVAINGFSAAAAVAAALPRSLSGPDPEAANFTLRTLLAGDHQAVRRLAVRARYGRIRQVLLPPFAGPPDEEPVTWRWLDDRTGYIRLGNSLANGGTVAAFDAALMALGGARRLVLDLRDTPSGGDTDVAEPIMGRFIARSAPYQRVFDPAPGRVFPRDSWLKTVAPRGPRVTARLVVLVDHWTGSMGEGMAIGFDAMGRATVVGTRMAGLSGGTGEFVLPHTGISIDFPVERLYEVNGRPRQDFAPPVYVDLSRASVGDPILARGLAALGN